MNGQGIGSSLKLKTIRMARGYWVVGKAVADRISIGVLDREGNARKVVNCSCVVVRDWGEESQERSILLNYFQTEQ